MFNDIVATDKPVDYYTSKKVESYSSPGGETIDFCDNCYRWFSFYWEYKKNIFCDNL